MTNEKEIEEAAEKYAAESAKRLQESRSPYFTHEIDQEYETIIVLSEVQAFEAGAHWAIKRERERILKELMELAQS